MSYSNEEIKKFLGNQEPFEQLSEASLDSLVNKLQIQRYRLGQAIMRREKMPPYVSILYEGKARLLGYDRENQMPVTLKLLQPGEVLGWLNLARRLPCETAIASTETVCLHLKNQDFLELLEQYPALQGNLRNHPHIVEIFDLLGEQFEREAKAQKNLKQLAQQAITLSTVEYLPPGKHTLNAENPLFEDPNQVWLVSGGGTIVNFAIGSRLHLTQSTQRIEVSQGFPVRLIGLPGQQLNQWLASSEPETSINGQTTSGEAIIPEIVPDSEPEREIEYAPLELPVETDESLVIKQQETERQKPQDFIFISGKTPLDAGVACFQMLSKYYGIPFRKEVIRRVLDDQIKRSGSLTLNTCGAVSELIGLQAQLANIPSSAFPRLNFPVLIRWQDSLAIIYEFTKKSVVIAVPELGLLKRKPDDFFSTWGEEGQILLLKPTKETPQERFGLSWFFPYVVRYRRVLIEVLIASFFVQVFALANPLTIRIMIDQVVQLASISTLNFLGIFVLTLAFFEAILSTLRTYLFVDTTNRIDMSLGSEVIDHLLRLPLRYFERRPVGEISTRVNELENIRQFLTGTALTAVLDAIFSFLYIGVLLLFSPVLTAVTLSVIPVSILLLLIFAPIIRKEVRVKAERNAETQSYLVEVMTGIQTVKAQNIELKSRWQWQEYYARYISASFKTVMTSTIAGSLSSFLNKLSGILVFWVGIYLVIEGEISLGTLIAFRILDGYVISSILRLSQIWQNFQETALSLERLSDIIDTPQEGEDDRYNIPMPLIRGQVRYENVSFRFKSGGPLQLYNINLDIPKGTFVAIVGQSGAGKSTITKLLSRLYEPESGRIIIDGYDINKVELYSLRRQVGVVPQDPLLFQGSVQDNISLTNPDASTEEVIKAAEIAVAHEFIMELSSGYGTRVGERGSSLSGGQRQRIAIARSILQNPEMLVLDEATSALDYNTEQQVCLNLIQYFRGKTVFFITHRLASIKNADLIIMMDSGSVVEQGSHEELMANKGRYYSLYHQQESRM